MQVQHNGYVGAQKLVFVRGKGPTLLGRDWLKKIMLNRTSISSVVSGIYFPTLELITTKYKELLQSGVGILNQFKASINLKERAISGFCRPHTVPFTINRVETQWFGKIWDPMQSKPCQMGCTYRAFLKKDEGMRISGDYNVTVIQALSVDQCLPPKLLNLFASLTGGPKFTKLDLTSAYQYVRLSAPWYCLGY